MYARVPQAMAQFVLKIEKLSHIMGTAPIVEWARAYGLFPWLWLLHVTVKTIYKPLLLWVYQRNKLRGNASWLTSFCRVFETSQVIYFASKPIERVVYCFYEIIHFRTLRGGGAVTFLPEKYTQFPKAWLLKSGYKRTQIQWIRETNSFTNYRMAGNFSFELNVTDFGFFRFRGKKKANLDFRLYLWE